MLSPLTSISTRDRSRGWLGTSFSVIFLLIPSSTLSIRFAWATKPCSQCHRGRSSHPPEFPRGYVRRLDHSCSLAALLSSRDAWHQVVPSALERKLLRKRRRQEESDAIAGQVDSHGVTQGDEEGEGESKTASFKKSKRGGTASSVLGEFEKAGAGGGEGKGRRSDKTPLLQASAGGESLEPAAAAEGDEAPTKPKARRKKRKGALGEGDQGSSKKEPVAGDPTGLSGQERDTRPTAAPAPTTPADTATGKPTEGKPTGDPNDGPQEKRRRGWGKGRSKSTSATLPAGHGDQDGERAGSGAPDPGADLGVVGSGHGGGISVGGDASRKPLRKKVRSRQKNIRKDNRAMHERPAHLRPGDPGFTGRELTKETRERLGLPQEDTDSSLLNCSKEAVSHDDVGWIIDTKPDPTLSSMSDRDHDSAEKVVGADPEREMDAAKPSISKKRKKTKYKNLALM